MSRFENLGEPIQKLLQQSGHVPTDEELTLLQNVSVSMLASIYDTLEKTKTQEAAESNYEALIQTLKEKNKKKQQEKLEEEKKKAEALAAAAAENSSPQKQPDPVVKEEEVKAEPEQQEKPSTPEKVQSTPPQEVTPQKEVEATPTAAKEVEKVQSTPPQEVTPQKEVEATPTAAKEVLRTPATDGHEYPRAPPNTIERSEKSEISRPTSISVTPVRLPDESPISKAQRQEPVNLTPRLSSRRLGVARFSDTQLKEVFEMFDVDRKGSIARDDVLLAAPGLGRNVKDIPAEPLLYTYPEFVKLFEEVNDLSYEIAEAFKAFGGGKAFSQVDLKAAVLKLGGVSQSSLQEIEEVFRYCDVDGDGIIDLNDWNDIMFSVEGKKKGK
eukprot:PhF_6_TR14265/c0_g1_i1/m.22941